MRFLHASILISALTFNADSPYLSGVLSRLRKGNDLPGWFPYHPVLLSIRSQKRPALPPPAGRFLCPPAQNDNPRPAARAWKKCRGFRCPHDRKAFRVTCSGLEFFFFLFHSAR